MIEAAYAVFDVLALVAATAALASAVAALPARRPPERLERKISLHHPADV